MHGKHPAPVFFVDLDGTAIGFGKRGGGEDGGDGARRQDGAVRKEERVFDNGRQFLRTVSDNDQRGGVGTSGETLDGGQDGFACAEVESGGGLVEKKESGTGGKGTREEDAHLLARGEERVTLGGKVVEGEIAEEFIGMGKLTRGRRIEESEGAEETGEDDGAYGKTGIDLEGPGGADQTDVAAQVVDVDATEGVTEDADGALGGPEIGGEHADEGGLSGPVGTEAGPAIALPTLPGDAAQDGARIALDGDIRNLNGQSVFHGHSRKRRNLRQDYSPGGCGVKPTRCESACRRR